MARLTAPLDRRRPGAWITKKSLRRAKISSGAADYEDALKSFKRANEMREKKCAECYAWMAETYRALEAYKNVIESADKVIEFANGDRQLVLKAYNNKGLALQASAERKDQKKLAGGGSRIQASIGAGRRAAHTSLQSRCDVASVESG